MKVTSLSDIAGQVTRATLDADRVTVAGVCLPTGALKFIRRQIPSNHPKWRDATDEDVRLIVQLLLREALSFTASSIQKTPTPWKRFWDDADDTHSRTAHLSGSTMSFVKAATLIKYALFGQCSLTTAHAIKNRSIPRPVDIRKQMLIQEELVFDKEIEGKDNIEAFRDLWKARNEDQPLTHFLNLLGITWQVVDVQLATEQQEPLLLLPDYVAGIVHAANSDANTLSASQVSPTAASAAYDMLKKSAKYSESLEEFDLRYYEIFPNFVKFSRKNPL